MPRSTLLAALRIALIYLVVAALWIVLSDRAVDLLVKNHQSYVTVQTWKGWFFVGITALILFLLVRSALTRLKLEMLGHQHLNSELAASRSIQAQMLEVLDDVVWMRDLQSQQYLFISPAVERIYGVSATTFMQSEHYWLECVHSEDRAVAKSKKALLKSQDWVELEYRIVHSDGTIRWLRDRTRIIAGTNGEPLQLIGIATDITLQRQHVEDIHRLSHYDCLTGLPNRALLEDLMQKSLNAAKRDLKQVGVLYMNISRLKDINDTFGHAIGDEVLRHYAGRLRASVTARETLARLSADEFAVILPNLEDRSIAGSAAQRVLNALTPPFSMAVGEIRLASSIGISVYPADAETPALLLQHASLALHDAKSRGSGQISFYRADMNSAVGDRVALIGDLHHALERNELELHYQPQIDLTSGRIVGAEALMRWRHPKRGLVPPNQFIPLAEESGLILPIGAWALHEACRQNRAWQIGGFPPMVVAVNISARQFGGDLPASTARALSAAELDPRWLELEVTESVIMDGAERMLEVLNELRKLNVQISIDDFGTGYSSLSYLTRFAVHKLKIDQAFVRGALQDERDNAIVGIIVQMAKALHLQVIAEGVETEAQVAMLNAHGCDEAQGYFYARPMPAADLGHFLRQHIETA